MNNNFVYSYRLWINLVKVAGVAVTLSVFMSLLKQPLRGTSLLCFTCLAILGVMVCTSLIDVLLESVFVHRKIVTAFSAVAITFIVGSLYFHDVLQRVAFMRLFAGGMAMLFLIVMSYFISSSDAEMDEERSRHYHLAGRRQQAKIYLHLAFNTLPYIIGIGGVYSIKMVYGESSALGFSFVWVAILCMFVGFDEALKRYRHRSLFWRDETQSV